MAVLTQRGTQDDGGQLCRIHCRLDNAVALIYSRRGSSQLGNLTNREVINKERVRVGRVWGYLVARNYGWIREDDECERYRYVTMSHATKRLGEMEASQ
jgi:hypothetical protein